MNREDFLKFRERMGYTQAQCAYQFGLSTRAIRSYEAGDRSIPGPVARLIEIYLNSDLLEEIERAHCDSVTYQTEDSRNEHPDLF